MCQTQLTVEMALSGEAATQSERPESQAVTQSPQETTAAATLATLACPLHLRHT